MKIERYTEERGKLDALYEKMGRLAEKLEARDLVSILSENRKKLKEDSFKIVVVGEFSRGKSTFLNAMMGRRILPAKTDPTTTIINDIVYGDELRFFLHYRDSEAVKEISKEDFLKIKAVQMEEDGEEYQKKTTKLANIAYAEIRVPLDICRDGIELIDTPGTNDLDQMREEITYSFIPQADAAIFLLSAEQPVTRSEVEFIRERILKNDIDKIFFVVNFKDRIDDAKDQERVMAEVRKQLGEVVSSPRAYLVSSKGALNWRRKQAKEEVKGIIPDTLEETGFADFEAALSRFLIEEKAETKLSKYRQRFLDVGTQLCRDRIAVRRSGIGASVKSIEAAITEMRPRIERARSQSTRAIQRLEYSLRMDVDELTDEYERGLAQIARQARRDLTEYDGELNIDEVARFLEERIAPKQEQHAQKMQSDISDRLNTEYSKAQKALKEIYQNEIATSAGKALVPLTQIESGSREVISLDEVADGNAALVGGGLIFGGILLTVSMPFIAIPAAFFGGNYILQRFRDYRKSDFLAQVSAQIRERYEKIIPEQKAGFKQRLQKDFHRLAEDTERTMNEELRRIEDGLNGLLRDKRAAQQDDQEQRAFLDETEREVRNLMAEIRLRR